LLKGVFAVKDLGTEALGVARPLERGDLDGARSKLGRLVSRPVDALPAPLVASAAVETVAENTTDSFVGPWLAFALLGLPGAYAYRAISTLDSMIGYRGRFEYLGKASARVDDLVNAVPARLSALLILLSAASQRLLPRRGWAVMRRDRNRTESPNAGWTMSAMAGVLGVTLEKAGHYTLGGGLREPAASDIQRAVRVSYAVAAGGAGVAAGLLAIRGGFVA
jgi:adenosylcobinamide-phosphate synthase